MFPMMPKADTMVNKTPSMIKRNIVVYFLSLFNDFNDYRLTLTIMIDNREELYQNSRLTYIQELIISF